MTEKTVDALKEAVHKDRIAAHRYLAFLDSERRYLLHELQPDRKPGDMVWFPCDRFINLLMHTSPLERAQKVLEVVGLPPHANETWVECLDINLGDLPIIGTAK